VANALNVQTVVAVAIQEEIPANFMINKATPFSGVFLIIYILLSQEWGLNK